MPYNTPSGLAIRSLLRDYGRKTARKKSRPWPRHTTERDLRLDLFRGIALWLIFLDHIPSNAVSWITIRNYGFSATPPKFSSSSPAIPRPSSMAAPCASMASSSPAPACSSAPGKSISRTSSCSRSISPRSPMSRRSFNNPLYTRGNGRARFPQQSGRHDHSGAAAEVQAGEHGRAAALHRAAALVSADAVAVAARAVVRARRLRRCSMR